MYAQYQVELKKNTQMCIYSLDDPNKGDCVEFTFFKGKFGRYLLIRLKKSSLEKKFSEQIFFHFHFQNTISIKITPIKEH